MKRVARQLVAVLPVLLALILLFSFALPASAATTQDVSVNATPSYVSIANAPDNYGFGTVATSTNYSTAQAYFTITNTSSVNIDIAISCNATWAGGVTWTHSDAGTPGADTAALYASPDTNAFDIIVENGSPNDLVASLAAVTDQDWELRLMSPTSFGDGVLKTNTVTLTASAS